MNTEGQPGSKPLKDGESAEEAAMKKVASSHEVVKDPKHATEASGYRGDNPSTAGPGPTAVVSNTPENKEGRLNPSAPENSNVTPGSTGEK